LENHAHFTSQRQCIQFRIVDFNPSDGIEPALIGARALMQRNSVDLPEPEGPMMQTISERATDKEIPLSTFVLPKDL